MSIEINAQTLLQDSDLESTVSKLSFEQAMRSLEELVGKVESANLPLDQAIRAYEVGAIIVSHLRALLEGAEAKLKIVQQDSVSKSVK